MNRPFLNEEPGGSVDGRQCGVSSEVGNLRLEVESNNKPATP